MAADKPKHEPDGGDPTGAKRWEALESDRPPEPAPRKGLGGFIERLGRLIHIHPRGPIA